MSRGTLLLADNNGLLFVETSALDSTNVEQAFETILKGTWRGERGCGAERRMHGVSALPHASASGLVLASSFWLVWFLAFLAACFSPHGFVLTAPGRPQSPGGSFPPL